MEYCPCNSGIDYAGCCEPYLIGQAHPKTPEALMRSRYTAYTKSNMEYIQQTMSGNALLGFEKTASERWAKRVCWIKLVVMNSRTDTSNHGYVEFEAIFVEGTRLKSIHEMSEFIAKDGRWSYVGGLHLPGSFDETMVSRSMTCPCGGPRKFKHCHGKSRG